MPACNCVNKELSKEALTRLIDLGYSLKTVNYSEKQLYREDTLRYKVIDDVWFYVLSITGEAQLTYADAVLSVHKNE